MQLNYYSTLVLILMLTLPLNCHAAAGRFTPGAKTLFTPSYRTYDGKSGSVKCSDTTHICREANREKIVQGVKVTRPCWQFSYNKTCEIYPSKDDCGKWRHCYAVADHECLTWDSYGNCVNIRKEYSCKRKDSATLDKEKTRWNPDNKNQARQLICRGIPCADGNCVDKSYEMNGEIMESTSKLYAISHAKEGRSGSNIFPGAAMHCTKKAIGYANCCTVGTKDLINNWGQIMGAHCTKDEKLLLENRRKNLCVYVGKENKGSMKTVVKHHYCCWGNLLNKVIQVEARKQLGISFGRGGSPDCRGLTLDELMRLDFSRMDLSEAYADLVRKMKLPDVGDVDSRVKGALPNIRQGDGSEYNKDNNRSGINNNTQGVLSDQGSY